MDVQVPILLNVSLALYLLKELFNLINLVLVTQGIMMMVSVQFVNLVKILASLAHLFLYAPVAILLQHNSEH